MKIMHSTSSFLPLKLLPPCARLPPHYTLGYYPKTRHCLSQPTRFSSFALRSSVSSTNASNEETVSVVHFEDFVEKDWSFLETDDTNSDGEHMQKINRIISAGDIEGSSKVLVSIGSEAFVDRVVCSAPCEQLLVVHDSLFILACIKEKYEKVKCWQGEVINVPDKWTAFDVVFLYFLPALPFELNQLLAALSKRCSPGARIVISHPQGREALEEQKQLYSDVVISNLPDKILLQSVASNHSLEVVEFADEPTFYLAVLRLDVKSDN